MSTLKITSTKNKNTIALKAFFDITHKWHLTSEQESILLGVSKSTLCRWKATKEGSLTSDHLERISYVLGIYKALKILLPNQSAADTWVHKSNSASIFGKKSALDKLMTGRMIDLDQVHRYLNYECS